MAYNITRLIQIDLVVVLLFCSFIMFLLVL